MTPDYNEEEVAVIQKLQQYLEKKGTRACAETYYCLARSMTDARQYIERNNYMMARRVILEGCELAEQLYLDMEQSDQ